MTEWGESDGGGGGFREDELCMRKQKTVKQPWVPAPLQWYEGNSYNNTLLPPSHDLALPECILDISNAVCYGGQARLMGGDHTGAEFGPLPM